MKKTLIAILLALALVVIPVGSAFADTTAGVTVTATPAIVSISNTPGTWDIDNTWPADATKVTRRTTYYSNPLNNVSEKVPPVGANVAEGECGFTFTNDGGVNVNTLIKMGNMSAMTNSNGGYTSNGAISFGASFYLNGGAWPVGNSEKLTTTDTAFLTNFAPGEKKWGIALLTQQDSFTDNTPLTGTITITATEV